MTEYVLVIIGCQQIMFLAARASLPSLHRNFAQILILSIRHTCSVVPHRNHISFQLLLIGSETSLLARLSVGLLVGRFFIISYKDGKLHFHTPLGALVKVKLCGQIYDVCSQYS